MTYKPFENEKRANDFLRANADKPVHERFAAAALSAVEDEALADMHKSYDAPQRPEAALEAKRAGLQREAGVSAIKAGASRVDQGRSLTLAAYPDGSVSLTQVLAGTPISKEKMTESEFAEWCKQDDPNYEILSAEAERRGMDSFGTDYENGRRVGVTFYKFGEPVVAEPKEITLTGEDLRRLKTFLGALPEIYFVNSAPAAPQTFPGAESFTIG